MQRLFGDTNKSELPFLLRLTHLLDQRERDWFVHADEKEAGSSLGFLPIGKEGAQVSDILPSLKRSISSSIADITKELNDEQARLEHWHELLHERDMSRMDVDTPLLPQEQLFDTLTGYWQELFEENKPHDDHQFNINSALMSCSELKSRISIHLADS
ncbi:MAG: hypothetical protein MJK04_04075, partial [Psychrosphaera sp.]|nr:hypothetical protein [Psychrosphaera sp.]